MNSRLTSFANFFQPDPTATSALIPRAAPAPRLKTMGRRFLSITNEISASLSVAAVAVCFYQAAASKETLETHTCEEILKHLHGNSFPDRLRALLGDYGLLIFYTTFAIDYGLIGFMTKMGEQVVHCLNEEHCLNKDPLISKEMSKTLDEIKKKIVNTLSIAILAKELPITTPMKYVYGIASSIPLLRFGMEKCFPQLPNTPSWSSLKEVMDPKLAALATLMASLEKSGQLGSCYYVLFKYFIYNFYDATHINDLPLDQITPALLGFGLFCGLLSVLNDRNYEIADKFVKYSGTFYLFVMPFISTLLCLDQSLENLENYWVKTFPAIMSISVGIGLLLVPALFSENKTEEVNEREIEEVYDDSFNPANLNLGGEAEEEIVEVDLIPGKDQDADQEIDFARPGFSFSSN